MSKIKSIIRKKIRDEKLWNLAIEKNESFLANGIFVHNCRSLLIPLTQFEDFTIDTKVGSKNIETFIEKEKGIGFSKFSKE